MSVEDCDWVPVLLGLLTDDVRKILVAALHRRSRGELPKISVTMPCAVQTRPSLFVSFYVHGQADIRAGLVWFDADVGQSGPANAPAEVRSQMRLAVHRILAFSVGKARR